MACNVAVPDEYNADMVSRRAAFIAFPQAVPKKAVISREGVSPCTYECPAGIKAHGYVARVRSGEYDQAFDLVLETTPLVGSLGRACYAPCEEQCTRGELEGPLPIRRLKRFIADQRYGQAEPKAIEKPEQNGKKVAVVGSGPAGLTAAWQLARKGYGVKIFEAAPQAGGMLRLGIPAYRLPNDVIDDDIGNVTAIGVEIETDARVDDRRRAQGRRLRRRPRRDRHAQGRAACASPARSSTGIQSALTFLADVKLGKTVDLAGKHVLVVGGGNVAIDAARTARRLGAAAVHQASLECCEDMPAHDFEVEEAKAEGITLHDGWGVNHFTGDGRVQSAELKVCSCVFNPEGKFAPEYDESKKQTVVCDVVIVAAGMGADTESFGLETNGNRTLKADPGTLQTSVPHVFAAGDVVTGPTMITTAVGQGRRAAFMIDRYLAGRDARPGAFDEALPVADKNERARAPGRLRPARAARVPRRDERVADRLRRDRGDADRGRSLPRRRPLPRLRRLLRVPRLRRRLPGRRDQARHARGGDRGRGRRRRARDRLPALPGRRQARVRLRQVTRTSSPACRWTACSPRRGRSTPWCAPATARCRTASATSCAPARATPRWATRCARASAACTRSSTTS